MTLAVAGEALDDAGCRPGELAAVGITNQRETVCVWDPATGEPLHRALVWQDRRTAARCDELRAAGHEALVRTRTGLVLDPYFSAARRSSGCCATSTAWPSAPATAAPSSARSTAGWSSASPASTRPTRPTRRARCSTTSTAALGRRAVRAARRAGRARCPRCGPSIGDFGTTKPEVLHGHAVPVAGIAGDQQAALYGQACLDPGMGKNTYGTGSFVLLNSGDDGPHRAARAADDRRLVDRPAHGLRAGGRGLRHRRRRCSGCATASGSSSAPRRPRRSRRRWTATTTSTSSPPSRASARRTGTRTRAGRSSG